MADNKPWAIAKKLRLNNGIKKPPVDVHFIAKNSGLKVLEIELDNDVWAILEPDKKNVYIREQDHEHRKRFSLAHELGHYFLNHCDSLHVEKAYRNMKSIEGIYSIEIEANQFAAELLMPAEFIAEKIKAYVDKKKVDIQEVISKMADAFKVSSAAMENRLKNLGYLILTDEETNESS